EPVGESGEQLEEENSEEESLPQEEENNPEINQMMLDFGYSIPDTPRTIDTIIVHSIYNALGGDIYSLNGVLDEYEMYQVAAHYLINRDGTIYQTAPEEAVAYHAGQSQMPDGRIGVNNFSIGIELINSEEDNPTEFQYQSLASLVNYLRKSYLVPDENILGHNDIAPERKTDPWNFDWEYFKSILE
ncbi:MAG: N-acetylmuramoyl-L-alanine amidase, partial [Candidatus Paceibacterota bacterium]